MKLNQNKEEKKSHVQQPFFEGEGDDATTGTVTFFRYCALNECQTGTHELLYCLTKIGYGVAEQSYRFETSADTETLRIEETEALRGRNPERVGFKASGVSLPVKMIECTAIKGAIK